ncbi:TIR domain-containing protein, partial [Candidatus Saccharibacteria bacterium]|nr:TIR domain-containing protein [Candidatus Saccharibacteria bacterium]NIW78617.1 TIR domain-containing protein [Calditrichia bacterium]
GAKAEPPEDAPTVFICHASEDKEYAKSLHDKLENAGLNAWIDQEDIRSGEDWNKRIKHAINEEIDYFVVLQSKAMQGK